MVSVVLSTASAPCGAVVAMCCILCMLSQYHTSSYHSVTRYHSSQCCESRSALSLVHSNSPLHAPPNGVLC